MKVRSMRVTPRRMV